MSKRLQPKQFQAVGFDQCYGAACSVAKEHKGKVVQLAGSPDYPNADERWKDIPPKHRQHYVAKVGSSYVDVAHGQFDPSTPVRISDSHGWTKEYEVD